MLVKESAPQKHEAIKLSLRKFLEKAGFFLVLVVLFALTVFLTPLDLNNTMAIVMPAVWTALTTIGGMGLYAARRYFNKSSNQTTSHSIGSYFKNHAAWIAQVSLLGYFFGLYFVDNLMMLSAEFGLLLTKFTFGIEALSACAFFGGSYLFCLCALFGIGFCASKAINTIYETACELLDKRSYRSTSQRDKTLANAAKSAGLKHHPFVKELQEILRLAPATKTEEILEWELKAVVKFAKTPKSQQSDLQKEILAEAKSLHYKLS